MATLLERMLKDEGIDSSGGEGWDDRLALLAKTWRPEPELPPTSYSPPPAAPLVQAPAPVAPEKSLEQEMFERRMDQQRRAEEERAAKADREKRERERQEREQREMIARRDSLIARGDEMYNQMVGPEPMRSSPTREQRPQAPVPPVADVLRDNQLGQMTTAAPPPFETPPIPQLEAPDMGVENPMPLQGMDQTSIKPPAPMGGGQTAVSMLQAPEMAQVDPNQAIPEPVRPQWQTQIQEASLGLATQLLSEGEAAKEWVKGRLEARDAHLDRYQEYGSQYGWIAAQLKELSDMAIPKNVWGRFATEAGLLPPMDSWLLPETKEDLLSSLPPSMRLAYDYIGQAHEERRAKWGGQTPLEAAIEREMNNLKASGITHVDPSTAWRLATHTIPSEIFEREKDNPIFWMNLLTGGPIGAMARGVAGAVGEEILGHGIFNLPRDAASDLIWGAMYSMDIAPGLVALSSPEQITSFFLNAATGLMVPNYFRSVAAARTMPQGENGEVIPSFQENMVELANLAFTNTYSGEFKEKPYGPGGLASIIDYIRPEMTAIDMFYNPFNFRTSEVFWKHVPEGTLPGIDLANFLISPATNLPKVFLAADWNALLSAPARAQAVMNDEWERAMEVERRVQQLIALDDPRYSDAAMLFNLKYSSASAQETALNTYLEHKNGWQKMYHEALQMQPYDPLLAATTMANAIKLRDMKMVEIIDQYQNPLAYGLAMMAFDPVVALDIFGFTAKGGKAVGIANKWNDLSKVQPEVLAKAYGERWAAAATEWNKRWLGEIPNIPKSAAPSWNPFVVKDTPETQAHQAANGLYNSIVGTLANASNNQDARAILNVMLSEDAPNLYMKGIQLGENLGIDANAATKFAGPAIHNEKLLEWTPIISLVRDRIMDMPALNKWDPQAIQQGIRNILTDGALEYFGVVGFKQLPFGAKTTQIIPALDNLGQTMPGKYVLAFMDENGNVLKIGNPNTMAKVTEYQGNVNQFMKEIQNPKNAAQNFGSWMASLAREYISTSNFAMDPVYHTIQNSGTAVIMSIGNSGWTWKNNASILGELTNKFGGFMPIPKLGEVGDVLNKAKVQDALQSFGGNGPFRNMIRKNEFLDKTLGKAIDLGFNIPYGSMEVGIGAGRSIPVSEGSFRIGNIFSGYKRYFDEKWTGYVNRQLGPQFEQVLGPEFSKMLGDFIIERGTVGNRQTLIRDVRDWLNQKTWYPSSKSLGIPAELLSADTWRSMSAIFHAEPGAVSKLDAVTDLFRAERTSAAETLAKVQPMPEVLNWSSKDVLREGGIIYDSMMHAAVQAGIDPNQAQKTIKQVTDSFEQVYRSGFQGFKNDLASMSNEPNLGRVLIDLYEELNQVKYRARASSDAAGKQALDSMSRQGWTQKFTDTQNAWTTYATEQTAVWDKYRQILSDPDAIRNYQAQVGDWSEIIARYTGFDPDSWEALRHMDVSIDNPQLFERLIQANRARLDTSFTQVVEALQRSPSSDGFDLFHKLWYWADADGAKTSGFNDILRKQRLNGTLSPQEYAKQSTALWNQHFDNVIAYSEALKGQILKHGILSSLGTELTFKAGGKPWRLIGHAPEGRWMAASMEDGTTAVLNVGKRGSKGDFVPQDIVDKFGKMMEQGLTDLNGITEEIARSVGGQIPPSLRPRWMPPEGAVVIGEKGRNELALLYSKTQIVTPQAESAAKATVAQSAKGEQVAFSLQDLALKAVGTADEKQKVRWASQAYVLRTGIEYTAMSNQEKIAQAVSRGMPEDVAKWLMEADIKDVRQAMSEDAPSLAKLFSAHSPAQVPTQAIPAAAAIPDPGAGRNYAVALNIINKDLGLDLRRLDDIPVDRWMDAVNAVIARAPESILRPEVTTALHHFDTSIAKMLGLPADSTLDDVVKAIEMYIERSYRSGGARKMDYGDVAAATIEQLNLAEQKVRTALINGAQGIPNQLTPQQKTQVMKLLDGVGVEFDNVVNSAARVGQELSDWVMLDYSKRTDLDQKFDYMAGYWYFLSRMPSRYLDLATRHPATIGAWYRTEEGIRKENLQTDVPLRYQGTVPNVFMELIDPDASPGQHRMSTWQHFIFPLDGYLNYDKYNYVRSDATEGEYSIQHWMGLGGFALPHVQYGTQALLDWLYPLEDGRQRTDSWSAGQMTPWMRLANAASYAARGQPIGGQEGVFGEDGLLGTGINIGGVEGFGRFGTDYDPRNMARRTNELAMELGTDRELTLYAMQYIDNYHQGNEPFANIPLELQDKVKELATLGMQAWGKDRLIQLITRSFTRTQWTEITPQVMELHEAARLYNEVGYDESSNPAGGKEARGQVLEMEPGLTGQWSANALAPGSTAEEPYMQARRNELFRKRDAIYADMNDTLIKAISDPDLALDDYHALRQPFFDLVDQLYEEYADVESIQGTTRGMNPKEKVWRDIETVLRYQPPNRPEYPGKDAEPEVLSQYYTELAAWNKEQLDYMERQFSYRTAEQPDLGGRSYLAPQIGEPEAELYQAVLEGLYTADMLRQFKNRFSPDEVFHWQNQKEFEREWSRAEYQERLDSLSTDLGPKALEMFQEYMDATPEQRAKLNDETAAYALIREAFYNPVQFKDGQQRFGDDWFKVYSEAPRHPGDNASEADLRKYFDSLSEYNKQHPQYQAIRLWYNGRTVNNDARDKFYEKNNYSYRDYGVEYAEIDRILQPFGGIDAVWKYQAEEAAASAAGGGKGYYEWHRANPNKSMVLGIYDGWSKNAKNEKVSLTDLEGRVEARSAVTDEAPSVTEYVGPRPVGEAREPLAPMGAGGADALMRPQWMRQEQPGVIGHQPEPEPFVPPLTGVYDTPMSAGGMPSVPPTADILRPPFMEPPAQAPVAPTADILRATDDIPIGPPTKEEADIWLQATGHLPKEITDEGIKIIESDLSSTPDVDGESLLNSLLNNSDKWQKIWSAEAQEQGKQISEISAHWDAYRDLSTAEKAQYMMDNPDFSAYYNEKYPDSANWWLDYTARSSTFTPRSFSSWGGGGGGGGISEKFEPIPRVDPYRGAWEAPQRGWRPSTESRPYDWQYISQQIGAERARSWRKYT